jgi:hypothetical protein
MWWGKQERLERAQKKRDRIEANVKEAALHRYGGTQTCPWCKQCAQSRGDWFFKQCADDPMLDELTCGTCEGTSIWLWGFGMMYIRPGSPPPANPGRAKAKDQTND